jgi:Tol biopolymer transport system component
MTLITVTRDEVAHVTPTFLPGGNAILFTIISAIRGGPMIAVVDLRSGQMKRLIPGSDPQYVAATGHLVYAVAGTLRAVAFDLERLEPRGQSALALNGVSTTRAGVAQAAISADGWLVYVPGTAGARRTIVSMDRRGNATPLPNLPAEVYRHVSASPDGTRFAATAGSDVRIYDFERARVSSLTSDVASERNPLWSPDRQRVFFTSMRDGFPQIFSRAADGTGEAELVLSRAKDLTNLMASAWATDRKLIFTEVASDLSARIGQLDLDRPGEPTMLPL